MRRSARCAQALARDRRARRRRHRLRSRRLVLPARPGRARLLVPGRRAPGHAHVAQRAERRRPRQRAGRARAGPAAVHAGRRAAGAVGRPRHRQGARQRTPDDHGRAGRRGRQGQGRAPGAARPGDPDLPGAADGGERRGGRARARAGRRRGAAAAGRPAGGGLVPLGRGRARSRRFVNRHGGRQAQPSRHLPPVAFAAAALALGQDRRDQAERGGARRQSPRPLGAAARGRAAGRGATGAADDVEGGTWPLAA